MPRARGLSWAADIARAVARPTATTDRSRVTPPARLKECGIASEDNPRSPLPLSEADLAAADHIVAVKEAEHRPLVEAKFPAWRDRVEYWHVHDIDCATPADAIPHLENEVVRLLDKLAASLAA